MHSKPAIKSARTTRSIRVEPEVEKRKVKKRRMKEKKQGSAIHFSLEMRCSYLFCRVKHIVFVSVDGNRPLDNRQQAASDCNQQKSHDVCTAAVKLISTWQSNPGGEFGRVSRSFTI